MSDYALRAIFFIFVNKLIIISYWSQSVLTYMLTCIIFISLRNSGFVDNYILALRVLIIGLCTCDINFYLLFMLNINFKV